MNVAGGALRINETILDYFWRSIFTYYFRKDEPVNINAQYNETIFVGEEEFVVDLGIDGALELSRNNQLLSSLFLMEVYG